MALNTVLSKFPIRTQIFIGFLPALSLLAFLVLSNFEQSKIFKTNFSLLKTINTEKILFSEIEKDVIELQRNVLVYSYVGYSGILKKVKFIQKNLEDKFELATPIVEQSDETNTRFKRMLGHYYNYKNSFTQAVKEKRKLSALRTKKIEPVFKQANSQLDDIRQAFIDKKDFEYALITSEIEKNLITTRSNIILFGKSPDSLLIKESRNLINEIEKQTVLLNNTVNNAAVSDRLDDFVVTIRAYQEIFNEIARINRVYLTLINVVLAGKAAEIDTLSNEIDDLISAELNVLTADIQKNIQNSRAEFIGLSILAGIFGLLSSLLIAMSIAKPVKSMAETLSALAKGASDINIPGQDRWDEVGEMAKSANEFKSMAENLEYQTKELEEFSYRTSHDLRSPLISSLGLLSLTEKSIKKEDYRKAHKCIQLVSDSLVKLDNLVKDILSVTKTKHFVEAPQTVNLDIVIDEALKKLSHMDNFNNLTIKQTLNFSDPIVSQKSRVVLVIENLLSNAIKYQDTEKDQSFVYLSVSSLDDNVIIEIEDNGLGIPKKQQEQMFSMFKRFHPKVSFGSGLGLYMMKKSVDVIDGDILFTDTNNGSKFTLVIPKKPKNNR